LRRAEHRRGELRIVIPLPIRRAVGRLDEIEERLLARSASLFERAVTARPTISPPKRVRSTARSLLRCQ
jgi:hypothetical protein